MTEILNPFGVGQYQSSMGLVCFAPAFARLVALVLALLLTRPVFDLVLAAPPDFRPVRFFARAIGSLPVNRLQQTPHQLCRLPSIRNGPPPSPPAGRGTH
jgi:hypothetical protein